jgi:hypothetical protein
MSISNLLFIVLAIAILSLVIRLLTRPIRPREEDRVRDELERQDNELKAKYANGLAAGSSTRQLVRVYSQVDQSLVKSLLDSGGIPSDLLFSNTSGLRIGVGIPGFNDVVFVVLDTDYEAAREIVQDYVASLEEDAQRRKPGTVVRNVAEAALGSDFVNPSSRRPELF